MDRWVDRLFLNNLIFSTDIMPKQWRAICLEEMRAHIYWVSAETGTGQDNMYHLYAHMCINTWMCVYMYFIDTLWLAQVDC